MSRNRSQKPPAESAPAESGEMVVSSQSLLPQQGTPIDRCPTSLDLTTERGKARAINCMGEADIVIGDNHMVEMRVCDYLAYPVSTVDEETGEQREYVDLVLFDEDGHFFKTSSVVAPHKFVAMLRLYGPERWRAGISIVIAERKARKSGRTYHELRVIPEE